MKLQESLSQSERTSSTEEVSQTIPEEDESQQQVEKNTQDKEKSEDSDNNSLPDSPVIENKSLPPTENNVFREVTVTGGGE